MKVRKNHISLPRLSYKDACEIVQKEYCEAYNAIVIPTPFFWRELPYMEPCCCTKPNFDE